MNTNYKNIALYTLILKISHLNHNHNTDSDNDDENQREEEILNKLSNENSVYIIF